MTRRGFSLLEIIVALSVLGIAFVTLFQLFSTNLRSTKKSEDYSRALIHARSIMDEALSLPELSEGSESYDFEDGFKGIRTVREESSEEKVKTYEIVVTISWPPSGVLKLTSSKTLVETGG